MLSGGIEVENQLKMNQSTCDNSTEKVIHDFAASKAEVRNSLQRNREMRNVSEAYLVPNLYLVFSQKQFVAYSS